MTECIKGTDTGGQNTLLGVGVLMVPLPDDVVVLVAGFVVELDAADEVDVA